MKALKKFMFVLVVLVMLFTMTSFAFAYDGEDYSAYNMAQSFVCDHLKYPNTAWFPSIGNISMQYDGNLLYEIRGYYDASNDYGVTTRGYYYIMLENDYGNHWHAFHLTINGTTYF